VIDDFLAEVAQHQYGWPESLRFTYDKARELLDAGVDGCLVECGVAAGVHPAVMARACVDAGVSRAVHLFDSFEGIPHGGRYDVEWNEHYGDGSGRLERTGIAACSLEEVFANLAAWGFPVGPEGSGFPFAAYVGWFQDTVPKTAPHIGPIAFLRLDGDLYESTKVCLEHLYPLVASGGVIVIDDWNLDGCRAATVEYLGGFYGRGFAQVYRASDDGPVEDGAVGGNVRIAPITASGDVWWTKP
jgi:O-methyltransferase